jgi:hypothetical protein
MSLPNAAEQSELPRAARRALTTVNAATAAEHQNGSARVHDPHHHNPMIGQRHITRHPKD